MAKLLQRAPRLLSLQWRGRAHQGEGRERSGREQKVMRNIYHAYFAFPLVILKYRETFEQVQWG